MLWNRTSTANTSREITLNTRSRIKIWSSLAGCLVLLLGALVASGQETSVPESSVPESSVPESSVPESSELESSEPTHRNEVVRGRVVWLAAALKDKFGISTVPEVAEQSLAIETEDDQLLPLVENLRGRAFRKDERLRDMDLEIWVRRYDKQPLVQVLRVFELKDGQRFEVDYWCDVCAIPMYETGPCACCQDHNRIRKRLVADAEAAIDGIPAISGGE